MLALMLVGCGSGEWNVETWGEDYIEEAIPADVFEDGCAVTYDRFQIELTEAALLDGNGDAAGDVPTGAFEMTSPGPQDVGSASVDATHYSTARFRISPSDGPSIEAAGTLACPESTVAFDWAFETDTTCLCEPEDLTIPSGGEATTQLTIHGDHLFYDGLENPDAVVRGVAIAEADADADGAVTLDELDAVNVAGLGYEVGQYSDVATLGEFVTFLTRTLGHVDGEGHCQVNL